MDNFLSLFFLFSDFITILTYILMENFCPCFITISILVREYFFDIISTLLNQQDDHSIELVFLRLF